ncbi:inositol phosphorylceramide synthase [Cohnella endophytica]|uniref:Inositol phosphorylceramide synthase n=1 Tax=Cohnella endophytica TaxID=2419778 RepID=A0A494Y1N5_9BACL|nr:phosphatase PAP2 family protein [Cohnella endophytica]RKP56161.1 inositol phosphorylceramide synthase [Cohnella endophytica]
MPSRTYKPLLWLLAIPLLNLLYALQNHSSTGVQSLVTEVDRNTPFIPAFSVPYLLWYPFLFIVLTLILLRDKRQYYRTLLSLCLGLLVSNLIFLMFQTTVPRPEVPAMGTFNRLVSLVYANDEPYNCFPSIHVMTSTLMLFGSAALRWQVRIPVVVFALSIIASTLFIKQHVIADVLAGILIAPLVYWAADLLLEKLSSRKKAPSPNAREVSRRHAIDE